MDSRTDFLLISLEGRDEDEEVGMHLIKPLAMSYSMVFGRIVVLVHASLRSWK